MTTFGTALGDTIAITLRLGYLWSGVMFAIVIAVPALAPASEDTIPAEPDGHAKSAPVPSFAAGFTAWQSCWARVPLWSR